MLRLVLCNCPPDQADPIARRLVEERLAACVNALPGVQSTYRWQGSVCTDAETTLLIKTWEDRLDDLTARLLELHPYDLPEILALPLHAGHPPYLAWVFQATRSHRDDDSNSVDSDEDGEA